MNPTNLDVVQRSQNREALTAGGESMITNNLNDGYSQEHPGFFNPNAMTKSGMIQMQEAI